MARQSVWILGGATLVAGVGVMAWFLGAQGNGPAPVQVELPSLAVAPTPRPEGAVAPAAQAEQSLLPAFDVVRVARDGAALVAGTAEPGAAVTVRVDGAIVAEVAADPAGQFVAMFALGASEAAQMMTLEAAGAEGVLALAEDMVMLTPRPLDSVGAEGTVTAALAGEVAAAGGATLPVEGATAALAPDSAPPPTDAGGSTEAVADGAAPVAGEVVVDRVADVPAAEGEVATPVEAGAPATALAEGTPAQVVPEQSAPAQAADEAPLAVAVAAGEAAPAATSPAAGPVTEGPTPDLAAGTSEGTGAAPPETLQASVETADPGPTALLIQRDGGVRVLDRGPSVMDNVVIDTISYSDQGDVLIAGRASRLSDPARLRIYLNNQPIAVAVATGGDWESDLPDVDPGIYTLRVDQVNDAGRVVSRFETPFLRESPEAVAAARARIAGQDAAASPTAPVEVPVEVPIETPAEAPVEVPLVAAPQAEPQVAAAEAIPEPTDAVADVAAAPVAPEPAAQEPPAVATPQALAPASAADAGQDAAAAVDSSPDATLAPQAPVVATAPEPTVGEATQTATAVVDQPSQTLPEPVQTAQTEPGAAPSTGPATLSSGTSPLADPGAATLSDPTPAAATVPAQIAAIAPQAEPADSAPTPQVQPEPVPADAPRPDAVVGTGAPTAQGQIPPTQPAQTQTAQSQTPPAPVSPPSTVAAPAAPRATLITVQPGHTLWAISRERYGQGDRYMIIVRANRGQIRNPDLIYPGQIFALPEN